MSSLGLAGVSFVLGLSAPDFLFLDCGVGIPTGGGSNAPSPLNGSVKVPSPETSGFVSSLGFFGVLGLGDLGFSLSKAAEGKVAGVSKSKSEDGATLFVFATAGFLGSSMPPV